MTDENKPTADADAEPVTTEEATEETTEETQETSTEPTQIDYEAELKRERERRQKLEEEMASDAYKYRHGKRDEPAHSDPEEDDDRPLTRREMEAMLAAERGEREKRDREQHALSIAQKLSKSDAEAQLILETWNNRVLPGSLEEQLEEAHAIVNRKRAQAENEELKRSLRSKETRSDNAAGTHQDAPDAKEPRLSPQDASAIKAAGMVWDGTKRMYKKPIGDGTKHLYFDPKNKKPFVQ